MTTIGYNDIENVLLSLTDPNTGGAISNVPGVSSPKINAGTSIYNEQGGDGQGIAGWSTNVNWSATDYNTVSWGSGSVYLPDGTELTISSGNTGNMSTVTYIYYDQSDSLVHTTTSAGDSVGEDKILLCVAAPTTSGKDATFQAFGTNKQSTFITADNIAADSITANEIQSNSIETRHLDSYSVTASKIDSGAITTSKLAVGAVDSSAIEDGAVVASKIEARAVTADKISVTTLSAITGNMGTCYVGNINSGNGVKIYRTDSSQGRIEFFYNGNVIGYVQGQFESTIGYGMVRLHGNNGIWLDGNVYLVSRNDVMDLSLGKLRIPVGSDLYN